MNHKLFLGLTQVFLFIFSIAQASTHTISGRIIDVENKPLVSANVILLKDSNVLTKAVLTDDDGVFLIDQIESGVYFLKVILAGYDTYTSDKKVVASNLLLPHIQLSEKTSSLNEVAVRGKKPLIELLADKIVVNVDNSIVSAATSALDVLQSSPGVTVDNNDNISLKGRQGVMVWINGKQTPMSGQDLANFLKSISSSSIDKVEIISNPGAKYDAAGTGGIINIKMKKDQGEGVNGSVNVSYGQGVYPKYNVGGNINWRHKKINVFASYNYSKRYWFNHLMLDRQFLDTNRGKVDKQLFRYDQDNYALFDFNNHIASLGVDYSLSQKSDIGVSISSNINKSHPKVHNRSRALDQNDDLVYYFNTDGRHENYYYNYAVNAYLRHVFDSNGKELNVDLDYAAFGNRSNQNFNTVYSAPDNSKYQDDYSLKTNLTGLTQIRSLKADYIQPLNNKARFETGLKSSFVSSDNEPLFFENGSLNPDPERSNHFVYNEQINAAYVRVVRGFQKYSLQVGLRMENTNIRFEQQAVTQRFDTAYSYVQLFPSIGGLYHLRKDHDLGISLSRRIERPNYQQLNPFKYFIDKTTYREGYPRLFPASFYSVELSHTYRRKLVTSLTYGINKGVIVEVIQPSDNDTGRVTVQTNKNLDRMVFIGLSGAYSFGFTKWWSNITNINAYYSRYEGNVANTALNDGRPTFDFNSNNSFILPNDFSGEIGMRYQARQLYGYMDVLPNWMINIGVQKNLLNKRATVRMSVQDIFWTGYPRATSSYTGYKEDFVAERETRQVSISLVYRFGEKVIAAGKRQRSGADDEKRRASNSGA